MSKRLQKERKESFQSNESISQRTRKKVKLEDNGVKSKIKDVDLIENVIKVEATIKTLRNRGIERLFPVQFNTYAHILEGKDLIGKDRTGSGKTLGFLLPTLDKLRLQQKLNNSSRGRYPQVLILLPTRELAIQVFNEFEKMKNNNGEYEAVAVYGGTEIYDQKEKLRKGCDIIIGTPGRVIDLINRNNLILNDINTFILDEADRMLDMGFCEDIEKVIESIYSQQQSTTVETKNFQTILFSATIPRWVHEISAKYLAKDRMFIDMIKINGNQTSETIQHLAINCPYHQRTQVIGDVVLIYSGKHCRTIIFTETKKEANDIMMNSNIKQETQVLHGDIPQKQREITFQGFREGKFKCLIATNVVARGLDIPEVDLIIQLDPPKEIDSYIHRAGRTARAGKNGACITFYNSKQIGLLERIEKKCKIVFKRIGTPQPKDIIKASIRDVIQGMEQVPEEVYEIFVDNSKKILSNLNPEIALAKALAYISGHTEKLKQRSILCAFEGYVTFMIKVNVELRSQGYIWNFLRNNFTQEIVNSIKGMKMLADRKGVVFDLVEDHEQTFQEFADSYKNQDVIITKCHELPSLEEDQNVQQVQGYSYNSRNNNYSNRNNNANGQSRDYNTSNNNRAQSQGGANRGKKELEIFIGGIPQNTLQDELMNIFQSANISFDRFNYLNEKGVAFAACKTKEMMDEALTFNEYKFKGRKLRVSAANAR